jgi:hypothetical protein
MLRTILVACILSSAALAAQTVEGRVFNATTASPIAGARVRLFVGSGAAREAGYSATTDAEGRFRFASIPDGVYNALYSAPGFLPSPYPGDSLPPFSVASGGDPVRLEAKLQPMSKISGRVLDASGKAVPNARLWLVWEDQACKPPTCFAMHQQPKANDKGEYEAINLDPGKWLLSASAPASLHAPESNADERLVWAQTFYPGVIDPQIAQRIVLLPGMELSNVDIKLAAAPVHTVRGKLLDPEGKPVPKAPVVLALGYGPTREEETGPEGEFEFADIVDNQYRLRSNVEKDGVKLRVSQSIEVHRRDLEKVELRLAAPFTLHGKLVMDVPEGVPAPTPPRVSFVLINSGTLLSDDAGAMTPVETRDGALTVRNVYPGAYVVRTIDSSEPYYLDSMRLGERNASESVAILSDAEPLTITYKLGGGSVRGTIEGCAGAHVFLVPQDPALRYFARSTTCGRNDRFEIAAVRPGEYYGLAISGHALSFMGLLDDPARLSQAARVTVRANESTSPEIRLTGR